MEPVRIGGIKSREALPVAARKWLDQALPATLPVPSTIRVKQEGSMAVRGKWIPFKAEGIYRAPPLSFIWRAKLRLNAAVWIIAEDGHDGTTGWGGAKLWGLLPMGSRRDPDVFRSQLVRNLGELPLLPPFLLSDPGLSLSGTGGDSFEVRAGTGDRQAVVRFELDDSGSITQARSPARLYDVPGGYEASPWRIQYGEHRRFDQVQIPTTAVATFEKKDGPDEYLRTRITSLALLQGS
jgi:hypothetical protein